MRLSRLIGPELETLLRENPAEVRELLDEIHPEDIADILVELDDETAVELLMELPTEYAAQVFERLDPESQESLATRLGVKRTASIATEMDADDRADFMSILPEAMADPLLEHLEKLDPQTAEDVEELTRWPETSAGGLMTTEYIAVAPSLTVTQTIEEIRKRAEEAETVDTIFVVDDNDHLVGLITLRGLLLADPSERVSEEMQVNVISVPPELDQEEVARTLAKYDVNALPVVDDQGRMLGVITSDDVLDVLTEEQHEDVHKMGAVAPILHGYFDASYFEYVKSRAPWLIILFVGGFFTATAMEAYGPVLTAVAQLAFFVPLLISAGGNSGSQSATLVIRGLAVGDISARDWWKVLVRELVQGLTLGVILALLGVGRALLTDDNPTFALLIGVTIVSIVTLGCVVGGMMPILLYRLGLDPATSSTPFIASLVDVMGIVLYLSLARWLLADMLPRVSMATGM